MIPIQVSIVGYSGSPTTLLSAYDEEEHILVVSLESAFKRNRVNNCMIITNDPKIERDSLFTEDDLQQSVNDFFSMLGGVAKDGKSGRLVFAEKAVRSNPGQSIEKDGIDTHGTKFRISENITCAQIAALATCWYANSRVSVIDDMLNMADQLNSIAGLDEKPIFSIGEIFTI